VAIHPARTVEMRPFLTAALSVQGWRVRAIDLPSGKVWIKRVERLGLRLRLQKGDPRRGLEAERAALKLLRAEGLPVVPLIAEGPDWIAVPDAGVNLQHLLRDASVGAVELQRALTAAARAVARLHARGFAHGRLVLRDICWDGAAARLIDLERFAGGKATRRQQAVDVLCLVQSWFTAVEAPGQDLEDFIATYRAAAGPAGAAILARTGVLARRAAWIGWVARILSRLRPGSREAAAVPGALALMRGL
jgi:tRNA A-37 threonylcarbamoyl transferase component Bud32